MCDLQQGCDIVPGAEPHLGSVLEPGRAVPGPGSPTLCHKCLEDIEKVYADPHLNGDAHPIYFDSCHSIPYYKLLEAHFIVPDIKVTITDKILTNQRKPYK